MKNRVTPSVTATDDSNLSDVTEISSEPYVRPTITVFQPCILFLPMYLLIFLHVYNEEGHL